eukprot:5266297-Prymnesium_polylepis.1
MAPKRQVRGTHGSCTGCERCAWDAQARSTLRRIRGSSRKLRLQIAMQIGDAPMTQRSAHRALRRTLVAEARAMRGCGRVPPFPVTRRDCTPSIAKALRKHESTLRGRLGVG